MSETVKIISPVDGSVYAERPIARDADVESAISTARAALPEWRKVPVAERARYMLAFLDALLAMKGVRPDEEIAALPAGWSVDRIEPLAVPGLVGERHMIVVRRDRAG